MIIDILMMIGTLLLSTLRLAFSIFQFALPVEIMDAITNAFLYLRYFNGVLPMSDLLLMAATLTSFTGVWYTYKLILWVWKATPFIGKDISHPKK